MLKALRNEGATARVLCLTQGEAYERQIENLGIQVDWVGTSGNRVRRLASIIKHVRNEPAQILQSSHFFGNLYAAVAGRVLGVPSIGAIRGDLSHAIADNGFLGRKQLKWPNHLIANSQLAVTSALEHGIESQRIDFVRNAVDDVSARSEASDREHLRILFAGRIVALKRPEVFLKLASELRRLFPDKDLRFQIAGDGPLRSKMEHLSADLGLTPNDMEFLGELEDMNQAYETSDLLVLTSLHEGTPNVVLEAMSYGIPVVATKVGGVPEVVPSECGILVDPDDFDGLVRAVSSLVLDNDLRRRMGRDAREYVRKNHSITHLQERLTNIYSRLMAGKRAGVGQAAFDQ